MVKDPSETNNEQRRRLGTGKMTHREPSRTRAGFGFQFLYILWRDWTVCFFPSLASSGTRVLCRISRHINFEPIRSLTRSGRRLRTGLAGVSNFVTTVGLAKWWIRALVIIKRCGFLATGNNRWSPSDRSKFFETMINCFPLWVSSVLDGVVFAFVLGLKGIEITLISNCCQHQAFLDNCCWALINIYYVESEYLIEYVF